MKKKWIRIRKLLVCVMAFVMIMGLMPDVSVRAADNDTAVKSIVVKNGNKNVTKKTISITEGNNINLKVTVKPKNAKKSITFKSSKPKVAKVNSKGRVTAKKAGTSKITVTVRGKDGTKKKTYVTVKVKAKEIEVKSVAANISKSQLTVGDTAKITATVFPENATDKKLSYSSSNVNVAEVNSLGLVTAKAAGTACITVKSSNGKAAVISVVVKDKVIDAERVEIGILPADRIVKGGTAQITAAVFPENVTDKTLTYTSSDESVAVVDASGKVTAKKTGTSVIKAETSNGKSAELTVTVIEKYGVQVQELIIEDGENSIYGKLYAPNREGTWPIVILSHGYNGNNTQFESDCRLFAENGYMAYAYDFCGGSTISKSSGATTEMTIFTEKSNLLSVFQYIKSMENVDSEQIFLLGGSQGGLVTTLAAEEIADEVKGMILYFPALCIADDWRKNYPTLEEIPETTDFWGMTLGKDFFTTIHDFDPYEVIGNYSKNVLIIWGDQDAIVSYDYVKRAEEIYPHAELIVVSGVGHDSSSVTFRENALSFMREQ